MTKRCHICGVFVTPVPRLHAGFTKLPCFTNGSISGLCAPCAGYSTKQESPQQYKATWDFPFSPEPALEAPLVPFSLAPDTTMDPLFSTPQDGLESKLESTIPAAPAPSNKLQHATSSSSSDSKGDHEMSKLQERIQKQKEKNARNQREFRKRVSRKLAGYAV